MGLKLSVRRHEARGKVGQFLKSGAKGLVTGECERALAYLSHNKPLLLDPVKQARMVLLVLDEPVSTGRRAVIWKTLVKLFHQVQERCADFQPVVICLVRVRARRPDRIWRSPCHHVLCQTLRAGT